MHPRSPASLLAAWAALVAACAGGAPPPAPSPENLPALEAELQRNPNDAALMTRVGMAYYEGKQYDRARDVLQSSLVASPRNYPARVYLGLTYEELGQLDSARTAYNGAIADARNGQQRSEVENRLELLTRKQLRQAARDAIAHEATLSAQPPAADAVAVFPFRYVGTNPDLEPVGRGLTQLMITDLSKLRDLRLLERDRVQALVDEMSLTAEGRVDPTTGARSGRMLRAARVVQGSLQDQPGGNNLRLDATVVDATNDQIVASGTATDPLQQLFQLQKNVLFRLVQQLGISLTPAERQALSERPTADLQAFLSYSRGLEEEDRGNYAAANAAYGAALARDPNFKAARERQQSTQRISQALQTPTTVLAGIGPGGTATEAARSAITAGRGIVLRNGVLATVPSIGGVLNGRLGPVSRVPTVRPELPEALGTDDAGTVGGLVGTIIIIITRP